MTWKARPQRTGAGHKACFYPITYTGQAECPRALEMCVPFSVRVGVVCR